MEYTDHHIGIPVSVPSTGERYSPRLDMYTLGGELPGRVQYHSVGPKCSLDKLIQARPHIAETVSDLDQALNVKS
ncbi:helicase, partial [Francisella tularensis subsp. holarctica]|nr:helicase [Francisella tularensis subsp. holarctica]